MRTNEMIMNELKERKKREKLKTTREHGENGETIKSKVTCGKLNNKVTIVKRNL